MNKPDPNARRVKTNAGVCSRLAGQAGKWEPTPGILVDVIVLDARSSFGRLDVLISPLIGGEGKAWTWAKTVHGLKF